MWISALPIEDLSERYGVIVVQGGVTEEPPALRGLAGLVGSGVVKPQVGWVMPLAEAAEAQRISETTIVPMDLKTLMRKVKGEI